MLLAIMEEMIPRFSFLLLLFTFLNFNSIKCRENNEFCSESGFSFLTYRQSNLYEITRCNGYYNFFHRRCVGADYYTPGTCGNLYDDPYDVQFRECRNFPHLTDCSKYYKCVDIKFEFEDCFGGMFFNNETLECDNVECESGNNIDNDDVCDKTTIGTRQKVTCSTFRECLPQHRLTQCPYGKSFNLLTNQCDLNIKENNYCQHMALTNLPCNQAFQGVTFDKSLFFVCKQMPAGTANVITLRQCPFGKKFLGGNCKYNR